MIYAIVLAAGGSRRMGPQKLLLPFGGKKVITHIVDELLASRIDQVIVVVGSDGALIEGELSQRSVGIVANPDYRRGMLSSVRFGIENLPSECSAVMAVLGDQPAISHELVDEMILKFGKTGRGILVPCYRGKHGHPLLFMVKYRDEIMTSFDETGLRGLLLAHPEDVFEMEVLNPSVLSDIDSPEDYRREVEEFDEEC
jgi:molybdenum cofactor cytidylyltransferase